MKRSKSGANKLTCWQRKPEAEQSETVLFEILNQGLFELDDSQIVQVVVGLAVNPMTVILKTWIQGLHRTILKLFGKS